MIIPPRADYLMNLKIDLTADSAAEVSSNSEFNRASHFGVKLMSVISFLDPSRIYGPQVPVPGDT